jgi:cytosine/adenosine deaminase-related metal-dependent hydrolase
MTTHLAESNQEFEMFQHAAGEMHHWLQRNERDNSDCGQGSPVQHLERCGALMPSLLAVHVNYLAPGDAELLGRRGVHVVHCPRSHAYFQHQAFPLKALRAAGVNIALATDSLATVIQPRRQKVELNPFEEMRAFARQFPSVPAETVLRMSTMNGGRALGRAGELGELRRGAYADMIVVPTRGRRSELFESLIHHEGAVSASMIGGCWAITPSGARGQLKI